MSSQWPPAPGTPPAAYPPAGRRPRGPADPRGPRHAQRLAVRRGVRHPLEILCLVVAVVASLLYLGFAIFEIVQAIGDRREPSTYAVILVLAPVLVWFARGLLFAQIRLRGVQITPTQYPEAYEILVEASAAFGLEEPPRAYVVGGNGLINAFASGHGFRRFVVVYSDLFEVGGRARQPDSLRFIIGHELGHIAAGHTSYWRQLGTFASAYFPLVGPVLSRSQEYTSDSYGYHLCPQGAMGAMATLGAGKYLNASVDTTQYFGRVGDERGFFVWWANAIASHPVLLWRGHALRDRTQRGRLLWRPRPDRWGPPPVSPYVGTLPPNAAVAGGTHPSQRLAAIGAPQVGMPEARPTPPAVPQGGPTPPSPGQAPSWGPPTTPPAGPAA